MKKGVKKLHISIIKNFVFMVIYHVYKKHCGTVFFIPFCYVMSVKFMSFRISATRSSLARY